MINPNINGRKVGAWVVCKKCNDSRHRILPGKETPFWWCQDKKISLKEGEEIDVEYLQEEWGDVSRKGG